MPTPGSPSSSADRYVGHRYVSHRSRSRTLCYVPRSEVSRCLVGLPAFKAGGAGEPRPAGSIPVHLRQSSGVDWMIGTEALRTIAKISASPRMASPLKVEPLR